MKYKLLAIGLNALVIGTIYSSNNLAASPRLSVNNSNSSSEVQQSASQTHTPSPSSSPVPLPAPVPMQKTVSTKVIAGNTLNIQQIGLYSQIVSVGVTAENAIDVPTGAQIGMWNGGAVPGGSGAVFLDGHVDGVFKNLHLIKEGQIITVSYNNQVFRYKVVTTEIVQLDTIDMNKALSPISGNEGLNIMTCAGTYIPARGTYDQRFIVYTVRI